MSFLDTATEYNVTDRPAAFTTTYKSLMHYSSLGTFTLQFPSTIYKHRVVAPKFPKQFLVLRPNNKLFLHWAIAGHRAEFQSVLPQ